MNSSSSTVTFSPNAVTFSPAPPVVSRPAGAAVRLGRTLARKWDMLGVLALMLSSAAYGVYALTGLAGL